MLSIVNNAFVIISDSGTLVRSNNLNLESSICLPASCSIPEVLNYTNLIINRADLRAVRANCLTNDIMTLSALDFFAM